MSDEIYYDQNVYNDGEEENPNSGKKGFAITALVLGLLSVVCFCCGLGFFTAPLAIIFAVIALVKRHGGKAMSIVGLVLASLSLIFTIMIYAAFGQFFNDYVRFIQEYPTVVSEYEETGELPDYIEKYSDEKYRKYWGEYDTFYDFFDALIAEINANIDYSAIDNSGLESHNTVDDEEEQTQKPAPEVKEYNWTRLTREEAYGTKAAKGGQKDGESE